MWKVIHTISFYLPLHQSKAHYGLIVSLLSKHGFVTGFTCSILSQKGVGAVFFSPFKRTLCSLLGKSRKNLSDYFNNNPNYFLLDPSEVFNYANLLFPLYFVHRAHMFYA